MCHQICIALTFVLKAGLFSAILAAFIIEVYKGLEEDTSATSAQILRRISMQLGETPDQLAAFPGTFTPSGTIVAVNMLWFSSLILSLFSALFGILVKQWIHAYNKWSEHEQALPKDMLALRDFYQEGFIRWRVPGIIGMLPALLQVALLLFVVGLVALLWTINLAVARILSALVATMIFLAALTIVLPVFFSGCPYKSPLGLIFAALRADSDLTSWQNRDLAEARRRMSAEGSDEQITMLSSILNIRPRRALLHELMKEFSDRSLLGSRMSVLLETIPSVLVNIFTEFTSKRITFDDRQVLRDLRILDNISRAANEADSTEVATAVMTVFTKISIVPRPRRDYSECLPVIVRTKAPTI